MLLEDINNKNTILLLLNKNIELNSFDTKNLINKY